MMIARTILQAKSQKPEDIKTEWFKVPFRIGPVDDNSPPEDDPYKGYTQEEYEEYIRNITYEAKARWGMRKRMGYQPPKPNGSQ